MSGPSYTKENIWHFFLNQNVYTSFQLRPEARGAGQGRPSPLGSMTREILPSYLPSMLFPKWPKWPPLFPPAKPGRQEGSFPTPGLGLAWRQGPLLPCPAVPPLSGDALDFPCLLSPASPGTGSEPLLRLRPALPCPTPWSPGPCSTS